ncbi:MAG: hypothetical protein JST16_03910 [Bdellovibrionales bacterium]|nr:hypothetical protein [Bdellovibrionales bacterium]
MAALPEPTFEKWRGKVEQFHLETVINGDETEFPELCYFRDFSEAKFFEGVRISGGWITLSDHVTGREFEIAVDDDRSDLDWDDFIERSASGAYGIRQHCSLFETPYEGQIQYQFSTRAAFNPKKLMFFASRFDDGEWFISNVFYEGKELMSEGGSGSYEYNKTTLIDYANGNGHIVGSYRATPKS